MRTFEAPQGYWENEDFGVWIREDGKLVGRLDPHLEVMNKSPTGYSWGYGGSGPAQLAFALLVAVIGIECAQDPRMFQRFKGDVIAKLDKAKGWKLTEDEILAWARQNEKRLAS